MRRLLPLLAILIPILVFTATAAAGGGTLNVVAFSTPKPVVQKLVADWQGTANGNGWTVNQSYGPSTSQANAIIAGQPCDIAFLSNALDVQSLVNAGIVQGNWQKKFPQSGFVANSVVAFVVRPGNPKKIHGWNDLVKSGVTIDTPDPFPSGGAKWNVLAAYGAQRKMGKNDAKAYAWVKKMFGNVKQQQTSASAAMATWLANTDDVLITYESEAYTAALANKIDPSQIIVPQQTMTIQLPMVPTKTAPAAAAQLIDYAHSSNEQKLFVQNGYRPVVKSVLNDPSLSTWKTRFGGKHTYLLISNKYFGGWKKADNVWFTKNGQPGGRMLAIEQAVGGPTS